MMIVQRRNIGRTGFTLAELVVVLVILAATAALLIPRLGFLKSQADSATAAAGAAQVASNLETYKLTTGSYPMGMDSLLDSSGNLYSGLWQHPAGPTIIGPGGYLSAGTPLSTSSLRRSFGHAFSPPDGGGSVYFHDHDPAATDPTNSATIVRNYAGDGSDDFAVVNTDGSGASLIRAAGYPTGTLPAGVTLIALGVGSRIGSLGDTMASAPRHSAQAPEYYGRYIALFAVYANGKAAEMKTVVDSFGATVDGNVSSYRNAAPDHN